jgi:hypothetical protein
MSVCMYEIWNALCSKKLSRLRLSHCLEGVLKPLTIIARLGGQLRELDVSFNLRSLDFAGGE